MSQLSLSGGPEGIVARIESLKKWQTEQQQRLLAQQSQQSAFLSSEHKRMYQALGLEPLVEQVDVLSNSIPVVSKQDTPAKTNSEYFQYDGSESEFYEEDADTKCDDPDELNNDPENIDEIPIKSPCKNFTELLEENLKTKSNNYAVVNDNTKPKKTYLKRGAGLTRYQMSINDLAHNKPKLNHRLSISKVSSVVKTGARKTSSGSTNKREVSENESKKKLVSRKGVVENRTEQRKNKEILNSKRDNPVTNKSEVRKSARLSTTSDQKSSRPQVSAEYRDKFEDDMFAKDESSYNTPSIRGEWRTITTVPPLSLPQNQTLLPRQGLPAYQASSPRPGLPEHETLLPSQGLPDYQALIAELMEVRRRDPTLFDTPLINNSADHSQRTFEREMLDELKIFELLEQKASNSSFCSTSSLVMRLMEHSVKSTPKRVITTINSRQYDDTNSEISKDHSPDNSMKLAPRRALSFASRHQEETVCEEDAQRLASSDTSDSESASSDSSSSTVNSEDISDGVGVQTSRATSVKRNSQLLCTDKRTHHSESKKRDASTNTDSSAVSPELLKTRLEQLENEIVTFRVENARVAKLKSELETEQRNFDKRKRQLDKELDEQKHQMQVQLEEEKAKLAKDKVVYDRYARELKEGKSARKKERDEISVLRSQISSVEEEFKMKESRWAATQARLRNQLRQLEKENVALKTETTELRTKNSKLEASHKQLVTRRPTDTKVLHEINKNLTKLAQETKVKTSPSISMKEDVVDTSKRKCRSKTRTESTKRVSLLAEPEYEKENDRNSLNSAEDTKSSMDQSFELVEREYERMFGKQSLDTETKHDEVALPAAEASSCSNTSGQREETVLEDGSVQTSYSNGNVRTVSSDGQFIVMRYHNSDVKETCHNTGTVRYLYADACTWHTTFPDGMELLEFSNGQTEKRFANGASEIYFPNGCRRCTSPGGNEQVTFPDGTQLLTRPGETEKILTLPNGQREIHTSDHKRREYPDGTVKLIYEDGVQETRYANGRIRLKDRQGNLIMDSAGV